MQCWKINNTQTELQLKDIFKNKSIKENKGKISHKELIDFKDTQVIFENRDKEKTNH